MHVDDDIAALRAGFRFTEAANSDEASSVPSGKSAGSVKGEALSLRMPISSTASTRSG